MITDSIISLICLLILFMPNIGELGEKLVQEWLTSQAWLILHHRWRCRFGEIDLVAQHTLSNTLAFVEVKTRKAYNLDANGVLAITLQKQAKICRTAQSFLAQYPDFASFICRFDVALVNYKIISVQGSLDCPRYQFILKEYLESAFESF